MARRGKTDEFALLNGYLARTSEDPREEGESLRDYTARTHTCHTKCVVRELDHNIDRDLANREVDAVELLARHLVSVGDITDPRILKNEVAPNLVKGDYDYALMRARMLSLTDIYEFREACPSCNAENELELDLSEIETVEAPDPFDRVYGFVSDDGVEAEFRILYAYDIECLGDILEGQDDEIRQVMGLRLMSINGETTTDTLTARGRLKGDKTPTPVQHTHEAVRLINAAELTHREKEQIRKSLEKLVGYPKLLTKNRCKFCRRTWSKRVAIEPAFFMASSGV